MSLRRALTVVAVVTGFALGAGALVTGPATGKPPVTLTLTAKRHAIDAGTRPRFTFGAAGAPVGSHLVLQRRRVTRAHNPWKTVATVHGHRGRITAPPVHWGRQVYRLAALRGRHVVARSKGAHLLVYGSQPMSSLCAYLPAVQCWQEDVQVGDQVFTFQARISHDDYPVYASFWSVLHTSCRSVDLQFSAAEDGQADGVGAYVRVLQGDTVVASASTPAHQLGELRASFTSGGPLNLEAALDPGDGWYFMYMAGSASCYTANGRPRN